MEHFTDTHDRQIVKKVDNGQAEIFSYSYWSKKCISSRLNIIRVYLNGDGQADKVLVPRRKDSGPKSSYHWSTPSFDNPLTAIAPSWKRCMLVFY